MNKNQAKGRVKEAKGKAKETAGKLSGDKSTETAGELEKHGAKAQGKYAELESNVKKESK